MNNIQLQPNLELQDGNIVFDSHNANMMSCNETAFFLLRKLDEGASETELAESLYHAFEVSMSRAENDVSDFVRILHHYSMIEPM